MAKLFKAIITSGGEGLRVKHMSRAIPKGFLPLYSKEESGKRTIMPVLELAFRALQGAGVSSFCVVASKSKTILVDYLYDYSPTFVFFSGSRGFGETALKGKEFAAGDPVFVHADDSVLTGGYKEAAELFREKKPDGVLLLRKTDNPTKVGTADVEEMGEFKGHKVFRIKDVEEKSSKPKSNYMLSAVYIFSSKIFEKLEEVGRNLNANTNEFELTDGIKRLVKDGKVLGILLDAEKGEICLNVGEPEPYYKAVKYSYENL